MPRTNPTIEREISCKNSPKLAHGKKWGAKGKKNYEACRNGFFATQQRPFITHNLIGAIILDEMIRKRFLSQKIAEYLLKSPKNAITSTTSHATSLSMTTLSPNMFIRQPIVILSSTFFNPFFCSRFIKHFPSLDAT